MASFDGAESFFDTLFNRASVPEGTGELAAPLFRTNDPRKIQAKLSRAQFEDYKQRFRPLEDLLFAEVDKPIKPVYANRELISGIGARDRSRYGVSLGEDEAGYQRRGLDLSSALADVDAENTARQATRDRQLNLLTNITGLGRDLAVQAGDAIGTASGLANQRNNYNEQLKAQQQSSTLSSIGTGAGLGFAVGGPVGAAVGAGAGLILDSIF